MSILQSIHLDQCLFTMPSDLVNLFKSRPRELVIAGGFIRSIVAGEPVADIDVFVNGLDLARQLAVDLAASREGRQPATTVYKGKNAITVRSGDRTPVQFVYRWPFATPDDLIGGFDLTVSKAAMWWDGASWQSVVDNLFYLDVHNKRMRYTSPDRDDEDGDGVLRMLKFCAMGYKVSLTSLAYVLGRLVAEDRSSEAEAAADMLAKLRMADDGSDVTGLAYLRE